MVHLAAGPGVRMQDQGDRCILGLAGRIATFDTPGRAGQNHLWHLASLKMEPE